MTDKEPVENITWDSPGKTEDNIREYVTQIMDMNHQALSFLRERASEFNLLAQGFRQMADWAEDAATQCQIKARQVADLSGEVISAEYLLVPADEDEEDDDIEEDDDDDDPGDE